MEIEIKYDKKTDVVYLYFSDEKVAWSKRLDTERTVDYSQEGEIRGIEFFSASSGVKTEDLPHRSAIERALHDKGFVRFLSGHGTNRLSTGSKDANDSGETLWKVQMKARIVTIMWTIFAILIGIGFTAVDILLARNLFVLSSLEGVLASMFGLVALLFPTVLGYLILLAWVFDARHQASRL